MGGATRMPIVRAGGDAMFGRFPTAQINPDEAVALGAAVQAGLKARDAACAKWCSPTSAPTPSASTPGERLPEVACAWPVRANHRAQHRGPGEPRAVFCTPRRQPAPRGVWRLPGRIAARRRQHRARQARDSTAAEQPRRPDRGRTCRFTYDINGLLEVDVLVPQTGERRQLVITDPNAPRCARESSTGVARHSRS